MNQSDEAKEKLLLIKVMYLVFAFVGVLLGAYQILHFVIAGFVMWQRAYYSLIIFFFLPLVFVTFRHRKGITHIPWFDYMAMLLVMICSFYFFLNTENIEYTGWEVMAPWSGKITSLIFCIIVLEAGRRAAGNVFVGVCFVFSIYPLFADSMLGFTRGMSFPFWRTVTGFVFGTEGLYGIPVQVVADLLIGFLIFAVALQYTGGGKFFLDLAASLLGKKRGGPAKIAVMSSGLMGSMSGSVVANVATTGAVTIPAMKQIGYPRHYAGAIEACASTGGVLMPPVMGAAAFIMANFIGVSYADVVIAAVIPSLIYYLSLLIQVDALAARIGLKGMPAESIPKLSETLKEGWPYLFSLLFLIWGLLYMKWSDSTPFYATALLLISTVFRKKTRLDFKQWLKLIEGIGKTVSEVLAIILAVGFIIASLSMTGVANAFPNEMISLTGGNAILILVVGALVSFILGMGMTVTPCYVFLAVVLVPALTKIGYNVFSVHLFVMYCGMLSYITPPVSIAAFTAAGIAEANPMKVGLTAMRMGSVLFFVPFFFVLTPALTFQAPLNNVVYHFITVVIGLIFYAGGLEGHVFGIGRVHGFIRWGFVIMGFLICLSLWQLKAIGVFGAIICVALNFFIKKGLYNIHHKVV